MKPHALRLLALALIAVGAGLSPSRLAAASTPENTLRYSGYAQILAVQFLASATPAPAEEKLAAFLKAEEIEGDDFTAAVTQAVAVGRRLIAAGVPAKSKHFGPLLAENLGIRYAASAAGTEPVARGATTAGTTVTSAAGGADGGPAAGSKDGKPAEEQAKNTIKTALSEYFTAEAKKEVEMSLTTYQSFFHYGIDVLDPFKLDASLGGNRLQLLPGDDTKIGAFLEFVYTNRWAWNEDRIRKQWFARQKQRGQTPTLEKFAERGDETYLARERAAQADGKASWMNEIDVQARLGYHFAKESELSANTLVGASNPSAELDVAYALWAADFLTGAFTVGPEVSYAVTTDRQTSTLRNRWFAGIGYSTAFKSPFVDENGRRVLLHMRFGWAELPSVRYLDDTTKEIVTTNAGLPRYFKEDALALEVELFYPIRKSSFLTLGGRMYNSRNRLSPAPWNIYLGVTTPVSGFADGLFPK